MAAAVQNASFASPLADAKTAQVVGNSQIDGVLSTISDLSGWSIALTVLAILVAYDQGIYLISTIPKRSQTYLKLANLSAVSYLWQKGSISGPSWKAPFTGPFLQSMNPKWEEYMWKWASGPLSCVSVFHK